MARYAVSIRSPRSLEDAFDYMADLRNFADWDPGVVSSELVVGDAPALGSEFAVRVKAVGGPMTLVYAVREFDRPSRFVAYAANARLISNDVVTIAADGDGSIVTYDAELRLKGLFRFADPLLSLAFGRIGDRAAAGLIEALSGERVPG